MTKAPELFEDFEVYKYSRAPIMAILLGASIVLHTAFTATVVFVPVVRDTLYIASIFSDTAFVEKDYDKTKIGKEDVTVFDFSRFRYPEGYFVLTHEVTATATTEEQPRIIQLAEAQPKILEEASQNPDSAKNTNENKAGEPGSKDGEADGTATANTNNNSNTDGTNKTDSAENKTDNTNSEVKPEDVAKADDLDKMNVTEINKKPLKVYGAEVKKWVEAGKIDLRQPFEVEITGELDADGKLQNAKYVSKQGGDEIGKMGGELVGALNDSNILSAISGALNKDNKKSHNLVFNIKRDSNQLVVILEIEAESSDVASAAASGLGFLFSYVAGKRKGKDEATVLEKTKATVKGKTVVINATLPNVIADKLIEDQLALAKQESGK